MSLQPAIGIPPVTTPAGIAAAIADVRRRLSALEANRGSTIHAGSISGTINPGNIPNGWINPAHFTAGAITTEYLGVGVVHAIHIESDSIETRHLQADSVKAGKIDVDAVTVRELAANSVTANELTVNSVFAGSIQANAVTATTIATDLAMADKILNRVQNSQAITTSGLSAVTANLGSISSGKLLITTANGSKFGIGQGLIYSGGTVDGVIATNSTGQVTLRFDAQTGNLDIKGNIQTGSSGLGNISGQIDGTSNVVQRTMAGDRLVLDAVTANEISGTSITAIDLDTLSARVGKLQTNSVETVTIQADAVKATHIDVTSLNAITSILGFVNAGTIEMTGTDPVSGLPSQIRTNPIGGANVIMDSAGLRGLQSDGTTVNFNLRSSDGRLVARSIRLVDLADSAENIEWWNTSETFSHASISSTKGSIASTSFNKLRLTAIGRLGQNNDRDGNISLTTYYQDAGGNNTSNAEFRVLPGSVQAFVSGGSGYQTLLGAADSSKWLRIASTTNSVVSAGGIPENNSTPVESSGVEGLYLLSGQRSNGDTTTVMLLTRLIGGTPGLSKVFENPFPGLAATGFTISAGETRVRVTTPAGAGTTTWTGVRIPTR